MEIKRIFFIVFGIMFLTSCSSELTMAKINRPSHKIFKENIRQVESWNKQFIDIDPDGIKRAVEEETYYFERTIKMRNHIIDSLQLLKKDKIVIIDSRTDNNGQRIESSHFFFEDKCVFAGFKREDSIVNGKVFSKFIPQIREVTTESLKRYSFDVNYIYESFIGKEIPSVLNGSSERTSYLITLVQDNKVSYYSVSGSEKYKVVKLY